MHIEELFRGYMSLEKNYDRIDMFDEVLDKFVSTLDKNQLRLFKILKREYNFFMNMMQEISLNIAVQKSKTLKKLFWCHTIIF